MATAVWFLPLSQLFPVVVVFFVQCFKQAALWFCSRILLCISRPKSYGSMATVFTAVPLHQSPIGRCHNSELGPSGRGLPRCLHQILSQNIQSLNWKKYDVLVVILWIRGYNVLYVHINSYKVISYPYHINMNFSCFWGIVSPGQSSRHQIDRAGKSHQGLLIPAIALRPWSMKHTTFLRKSYEVFL